MLMIYYTSLTDFTNKIGKKSNGQFYVTIKTKLLKSSKFESHNNQHSKIILSFFSFFGLGTFNLQ